MLVVITLERSRRGRRKGAKLLIMVPCMVSFWAGYLIIMVPAGRHGAGATYSCSAFLRVVSSHNFPGDKFSTSISFPLQQLESRTHV